MVRSRLLAVIESASAHLTDLHCEMMTIVVRLYCCWSFGVCWKEKREGGGLSFLRE